MTTLSDKEVAEWRTKLSEALQNFPPPPSLPLQQTLDPTTISVASSCRGFIKSFKSLSPMQRAQILNENEASSNLASIGQRADEWWQVADSSEKMAENMAALALKEAVRSWSSGHSG
jgi:hypothetical protein